MDPLRTASCAYSTCNKWPSGENTVIALSYLEPIITIRFMPCNYLKQVTSHAPQRNKWRMKPRSQKSLFTPKLQHGHHGHQTHCEGERESVIWRIPPRDHTAALMYNYDSAGLKVVLPLLIRAMNDNDDRWYYFLKICIYPCLQERSLSRFEFKEKWKGPS